MQRIVNTAALVITGLQKYKPANAHGPLLIAAATNLFGPVLSEIQTTGTKLSRLPRLCFIPFVFQVPTHRRQE